jgi:hypothetical protein
MINTHARQIAVMVAAAGSVAASTFAQPPARQIPIVRTPTPGQPATQPAQPSQPPQSGTPTTSSPGTQPGTTVPVAIGDKTYNVSPADAANIAAWRDKLRQIAIAKGIEPVRRADGLPTYLNSKDYIVPTDDGKKQGIVSLPANMEIGVWFAGPGADGKQLSLNGAPIPAKPATPPPTETPSLFTQLANVSGSHVQTEIPQLTPVAMTPEAVDAARKQYPKDQGWNEIWLPNGGKLFARTSNPAELTNGLSMLSDAWSVQPPCPGGFAVGNLTTVNDLANAYKRWNEMCYPHRCNVKDSHYWGQPSATEEADPPKYMISADVIPSQIQLIEESQKTVTDDGRLERALAISEMQQLTTWKQGVQRLANVYLAHPELTQVAPARDFSDLTTDAMRKMINQVVSDANRNSDPKSLTAAAVLMASERRVEPALNTLSRARKFTTDQSGKDAIDGLFAAINALPRQ